MHVRSQYCMIYYLELQQVASTTYNLSREDKNLISTLALNFADTI